MRIIAYLLFRISYCNILRYKVRIIIEKTHFSTPKNKNITIIGNNNNHYLSETIQDRMSKMNSIENDKARLKIQYLEGEQLCNLLTINYFIVNK